MMTLEEIKSIESYCSENSVTIKQRLHATTLNQIQSQIRCAPIQTFGSVLSGETINILKICLKMQRFQTNFKLYISQENIPKACFDK